MRKQTKIAAVVSAAALLAIGASMTSFAATGWVEEDGSWVYYDRYEDRVTDSWQKSGGQWFYLGDDGMLASDTLVEKDDDLLYVDENGAMVTNRWVELPNDSDDENASPTVWYYFRNTGKAVKANNSGTTSTYTVNGKKYAFDADGKMLYGWVNTNATREADDEGWKNATYYFGESNDGAQVRGEWKKLSVIDNDEEKEYWFYFGSNGKKYTDDKKDYLINGKRYTFAQAGNMLDSWVDVSTATNSNPSNIANYNYFSDPESGAKVTRGWFKVIPDKNVNLADSEDGDSVEHWYYADGRGNLAKNEVKTVKGKKYLFNDNGEMVSGLVWINFDANGRDVISSIIVDKQETVDMYTKIGADRPSGRSGLYFFGDEEDGSMKFGNVKAKIDGEEYDLLFKKSGYARGLSVDGKDGNSYYINGKRVEADSDLKYQIFDIVNDRPVAVINNAFAIKNSSAVMTSARKMPVGNQKAKFIGSDGYMKDSAGNVVEGFNYSFTGTPVLITDRGIVIKSGTRKDTDGNYIRVYDKKATGVYVSID